MTAAVHDAIMAEMGTFWGDDEIAVLQANEGAAVPADGSEFIMVQFPVSDTRRWPVGNRYYREEGAFRIVYHAQQGKDLALVLQTTDDLASAFRDKDIDGVKCLAPSSPALGDFNDQGNYFVVAIVVPYTYDYAD